MGECENNPNYMLTGCAGSCGTCELKSPQPQFNRQTWRVFDHDGRPVQSAPDAATGGMFLAFEGGQFIWPGVHIGFQRQIHVGDKEITLETLALQPLVLSVTNFLSDAECDHVISQSKPHMAASKVSLMDHDKGKADAEFRTSTTYFLPSRTRQLQRVDRRVSELTRVEKQHQEYVQVLRYQNGQYYGSHLDYFDPDFYQVTRRREPPPLDPRMAPSLMWHVCAFVHRTRTPWK